MKDLDDVQSDTDSVISTDSGKSMISSWQRRYPLVSERGGLSLVAELATQQFSGVPFPDLENVDKPYHTNRELSSYDLERIYLMLALTPYVSPYRAQSFDNLPPLLFVAGQRELL
ncbi:hypothetical protein M427DRAFT_133783 [Gonapodya prolifera JEL478]|uniref:Uncharacterized protein n=1 Tax=Gonapodya prolifera (strain JEL478) TaxID=1344416 RepID=A0A139AJQ4_GONPJ|nr:hypothetical protein M427DRAFT_133783 [Gonapodya prolifera JEL478]|eukprot:KXS17012.1 hypothetical protein M427DRAFT_133783 [Gonapodya prolifera JEL478]